MSASSRARGGVLAAPVLVLLLSSCEYLKALSFDKADVSGNQINTTVLVSYLPYEGQLRGLLPNDTPLAEFDQRFLQQFDECRKAPVPKALPPLVGLAFGWAAGYIDDYLASVVTELRSRSQRTYGAHAIVDLKGRGAPFYGNECVVVIRGAIAEKDGIKSLSSVGMAAIFRVKRYGDYGMVFVPSYLKMKDAIAVTKKAETPVVNVSMAISIASAGVVNEVPSVIQTAADAFNFGAVPVSAAKRAAIDCDASSISSSPKACLFATKLLAQPPGRASALMISVGVTESGTGTPNAEKALAEVKALRQALGPLLEQKILEVLSKP